MSSEEDYSDDGVEEFYQTDSPIAASYDHADNQVNFANNSNDMDTHDQTGETQRQVSSRKPGNVFCSCPTSSNVGGLFLTCVFLLSLEKFEKVDKHNFINRIVLFHIMSDVKYLFELIE